MLSPVFMREEEDLGRLTHEKLGVFRESKKSKVKSRHFSVEKVKAMLLAAEAMLLSAEGLPLHAEVMLLYALKECMEIKFYFSLAALKLLPILLKMIVSESM